MKNLIKRSNINLKQIPKSERKQTLEILKSLGKSQEYTATVNNALLEDRLFYLTQDIIKKNRKKK